MKVYVSADIEGIAGIVDWDETSRDGKGYEPMRQRMTAHVAAACEGALSAGAREVLVKDAHGSGQNIVFDRLPREARLVRGWSWHPLFMVQELDASFDALVLVGYHDRSGSGGNPLAHTFSNSALSLMVVNGEPVNEMHLVGWAAATLGVPLVFLTGDEGACAAAERYVPGIVTVPVLRGVGASTVSLHPGLAEERIRAGVEKALRGDLAACVPDLADRFEVTLSYKEAHRAYKASHYPGARAVDDTTVSFAADDWMDVLRALIFLVY